MAGKSAAIEQWVKEVSALTTPDRVVFCDGSQRQGEELIKECVATGELIPLNQDKLPGCHLHRSAPHDVARTEHLTFISTTDPEDAGPNNNWMAREDARAKLTPLFKGSMKGRTMYVVPFLMGPPGSRFSKVGVEITDSKYVVLNMRIMTRVGQVALDHLTDPNDFTRCLHSLGDLSPDRRFIVHFPEENAVWSIGSGYGGNALLGKKCMALRLASWIGRKEGWLAEHMLILGLESPQGKTHYITAAFPSACGKTNLAMLIPPESYREAGWKVWTVGDDICWMRPGTDGRLYAINPEAGFFGVAPGTSEKSNPNALATIGYDTIFTNVAITDDNQPWWEGLDERVPAKDWQGRDIDAGNGPAAHPNSRFTVAARQCPSHSPSAEDPHGVPISAIVFGGRRASLVPLVFEARDWTHGVLVGASMGSETTAAATGAVGVMRRDPMAMKPFCGYNFADYFAHWLSFDQPGAKLPKIFHVNWFRKGEDGQFLWPGFGENLRVLEWMIERVEGKAEAIETPIGRLPDPSRLKLQGIPMSPEALDQLFKLDPVAWRAEFDEINDYFRSYGPAMPDKLCAEAQRILAALG